MTPQGIATVARQEFTIRIRAGRWRWLLVAWFVALMLFTLLVRASIARLAAADVTHKGVVVYGALTLLVLALALLVVPSLAGQSVNGDRERGTLATLQVTRLTAGDIAVGKLAAAWGTSLVFLALSLPMVLYSVVLGGVTLARVVVVTVVIALLLGTVAAVALMLSSLLARTTTSGVLSYLTVFVLTIGTLIAFGIGTAVTTEEYTETSEGFCVGRDSAPPGVPGPVQPAPATPAPSPVPAPGPQERVCQPGQSFTATRPRTDRVWWLLAPNPFVILADAAPKLPPLPAEERRRREEIQLRGGYLPTDLRDYDPLGGIGTEVAQLRLAPGEALLDDTGSSASAYSPAPKPVQRKLVWPYGLAFDVLLGAAAVWVTARGLRTPTRTLPKGQRVA